MKKNSRAVLTERFQNCRKIVVGYCYQSDLNRVFITLTKKANKFQLGNNLYFMSKNKPIRCQGS